jgi:hypothetical protein
MRLPERGLIVSDERMFGLVPHWVGDARCFYRRWTGTRNLAQCHTDLSAERQQHDGRSEQEDAMQKEMRKW